MPSTLSHVRLGGSGSASNTGGRGGSADRGRGAGAAGSGRAGGSGRAVGGGSVRKLGAPDKASTLSTSGDSNGERSTPRPRTTSSAGRARTVSGRSVRAG